MIDENFYIQLKDFFRKHGITQGNIAEALGTRQSFVSAMFNGRRTITRQTASKLAAAYGLSVAWLLTGEGEMLSAPNGGSVNHISIDAGGIHASGGSSVSNVRQGTAADATTVDKLIDVMTRQQEQIDQLLKLIKREP